jgi:hypothetical protein
VSVLSQVRGSGLGVMHPTLGEWIMGIRSELFVLGCFGLFGLGACAQERSLAAQAVLLRDVRVIDGTGAKPRGACFVADSGWAD